MPNKTLFSFFEKRGPRTTNATAPPAAAAGAMPLPPPQPDVDDGSIAAPDAVPSAAAAAEEVHDDSMEDEEVPEEETANPMEVEEEQAAVMPDQVEDGAVADRKLPAGLKNEDDEGDEAEAGDEAASHGCTRSATAPYAAAASYAASYAASSRPQLGEVRGRTPVPTSNPPFAAAAASARSDPWDEDTDDEYGDSYSARKKPKPRLDFDRGWDEDNDGGVEDDRKPAANPVKVRPNKRPRDDVYDIDSPEKESKKKKKKRRRKKEKTASTEGDESWDDPRRGGAARGGDSAALKRDENSVNATLAYADMSSNLYTSRSDNLRRHTFSSYHAVPEKNEDQRAATRAAKSTCLRAVNHLAECNEVIDVHSPIYHLINRDHKMFNANNGRTNAYHIENRSADGRYDGKFGNGGPDRAGYYINELGEETFERHVTMTSIVDLDNIVADTQREFTKILLDGLRPLGCKTIPTTVFDLVECSRTGLPAALQLAILLLDTPSTQCNDLGGLMEISGWLLDFAKHSIETGVTERARRRLPPAASVNFQQPDEWLRCNDIGFGVAGQQHGYSAINELLTLFPERIQKKILKDRHVLTWLANWKPGVIKTEETQHRPDFSRGTENLYAMFCPGGRNFIDAQETPPTGDRDPSSGDIDLCYDTSLYTRSQNRGACDKRDGVLHDHAMRGGGLLVVEQCNTSMKERGGMDMVSYIRSLRPFEDQFDEDQPDSVELTGVEPRWTPVLDRDTGKPLQVLDRIVFLYMDVGWDNKLRIIAVINNPSDIFDSNTKRPQTEEFVSEMCKTAMGMDGLKYFSTLLETENAVIVEKIDIRTMPFRDSFSAMFGLVFYYKKFLKLCSKSSSLFLQNLMQPSGVNLNCVGRTGLQRTRGQHDLFGLSARAEATQHLKKVTGIDRDNKVLRSIVAGGSNGTTLEECLQGMKEATLRDRKGDSDERITDPKKISNNSRYFVRKAREDGFIKPELIDRYEAMFQSETANSGNPDNHNTSAYGNLTTLDEQVQHLVDTQREFWVQGVGNADINNPNWGKDFPVTTPTGETRYREMIIPPAGPLTYKVVGSKQSKTIDDYHPGLVVRGTTAGTLRDRCNSDKHKKAVAAAEKQAANGKASKRKKTVWFPDYQLQIKRGMAKYKGRKIAEINDTNLVKARFVLGNKGVVYYD